MSVSKKLRAGAGRMYTQGHAGAPTPWRRTRQHVHRHRWAQAGARPLTLAEKTDTREQRCRHARCEAATHTEVQTQRHPQRGAWVWGADRDAHGDTQRHRNVGTHRHGHKHAQVPCTGTHGPRHKCRHKPHPRTTFFSVKER